MIKPALTWHVVLYQMLKFSYLAVIKQMYMYKIIQWNNGGRNSISSQSNKSIQAIYTRLCHNFFHHELDDIDDMSQQ